MCVVAIGSISCPATPAATAAEKNSSSAADDKSIVNNLFAKIGGEEGNPNKSNMDDTADDGTTRQRGVRGRHHP